MLALEWLSLSTYALDGYQTFSDCISYKEQLIELTDDPDERRRHKKELETMMKAKKLEY